MNLSINGTINFNGIEVKNIEGGFREGEKNRIVKRCCKNTQHGIKRN